MTVEELNALVADAYEAAFAHEQRLTAIYLAAFTRSAKQAAANLRSFAVTAAGFVPPPLETLAPGLTPEEQQQTAKVREDAAEAVAAMLVALGLAAIAAEFMAAVAQRGSINFDDELLRVLRQTVGQAEANGWSADQTAIAIQDAFKGVSPTTAQMLAQTELTTIVNERSLQAAQAVAADHPGPIYKVWQTMQDPRVRPAHAAVQSQTVPVSQPFQVGGFSMMYPGDTSAPMRLVARCRCQMTYTQSLTAAGALDASNMAMVAVYPRQVEARALALNVDGAQPFDSLHVTLIFLGEADSVDLEGVNETLGLLAASFQPLVGNVGGVGYFAAGPDGVPILALPDVPGLSCLRETVCAELAAIGIESPSEHGWLPHMTLLYADSAIPDFDSEAIGEPLHFDTISVVVADERTDYRLGGVPAASAEEDTLMSVTSPLTAATIVVVEGDDDDDDDDECACLSCGALNDADAQVCDQCGAAMPMAEAESPAEDAAEPGEEPMSDPGSFRALLAIEGEPTEDGRLLVPESITWRDLPLSLMAMDTTGPGGHEGAQVAGRIDSITRDGAEIWGAGQFDSGEFGQQIRRMIGEQTLTGNSVDLAVIAFEYRNANGDTLDQMQAMEAMVAGEKVTFAVTEGVIMASTVCPTPAIAGAEIMLASGVVRMTFSFEPRGTVLTAAGAGLAPLAPPLAWFENPGLTGPTPLTVTPEGRVYGHAALWDSCHIAEPSGPGVCVPPPRSGMQYEIFHHGAVTTAEGVDVPCGQITMSSLHAGRDLGWKAALHHYENSAICAADVVAGEDDYGIWVSGGIRPDLSAEKLREMKAGSLSGDWREVIGRGLEFLGALVVNIPGFPIPRPEARIVASASGEEQVLALVAAGIVTEEDVVGMSRQEYLRKIESLTRIEYADGFAITQADRDKAAKSGAALPDGSYPITKCSGDGSSAENAIRSQGRAPDQAKVVAHIRKRVAALGCSGPIFDKYK